MNNPVASSQISHNLLWNKILSKTTNINRLNALCLIHEAYQNNIKSFFVSPGMRNAPMLWALEQYKTIYPDLLIDNGVDERAHAYKALGHSKATGQISALVCTSGTAMANYYPALLEAQKTQTALMVITADRPSEVVVSGANQTMNQVGLFQNVAPTLLNIDGSQGISPHRFIAMVSWAMGHAQKESNQPFHLNFSWREPLDGGGQQLSDELTKWTLQYLQRPRPYCLALESENFLNHLNELGHGEHEVLVVIGELTRQQQIWLNHHEDILSKLAERKVPFYLDVTSGQKYNFNFNEGALPTFEHPEVLEWAASGALKLVLHIGGRVTSKHYYSLLEKNPQIELALVNNYREMEDPSFRARYRISEDPAQFLRSFMMNCLVTKEQKSNAPSIEELFLSLRPFAAAKIHLIEQGNATFPLLSKSVIELLPHNSQLVLGNSTAVRSFDSYVSLDEKFPDENSIHGPHDQRKKIKTLANRGVSGIEGLIATAMGASLATPHTPTVLIVGDVSAIHDLNSLVSLKQHRGAMVVIIANDFGGGIFHLLGLKDMETTMHHLSTPHDLKISPLAQMLGIKTEICDSIKQFRQVFPELLSWSEEQQRPVVIEYMIDQKENLELYQQLRTIK